MNHIQKVSTNAISKHAFNKVQKMFLHKSIRPSVYNLRLYYSNMKRNENTYSRWDQTWAPEGYDKSHTDRDPKHFAYKTNLFTHSYSELLHIYGDLLLNIARRRNRFSDPFFKYFYPFFVSSLYLLSGQHLFFMVSSYSI